MTGADWQMIASSKMFSQHARCGNKTCPRKEEKLDLYKYPRAELAHRVPKTVNNVLLYGVTAIEHPDNLVLVHEGQRDGIDCNDAVLMDRKANPVAAAELMAKIQKKLDVEQP